MKVNRSNIAGGVVVLSVLAAGCLLTLFIWREQAKGRQAGCANNLRKIGQSIGVYIADNEGHFPTSDLWFDRAIPGVPQAGCPAVEPLPKLNPPLPHVGFGIPGYAYNEMLSSATLVSGRRLATSATIGDVTHPQTTIIVCDYTNGITVVSTLYLYQQGYWPKSLLKGWKRHNDGGNYLFVDGHLQWLKEKQIVRNEVDFCSSSATRPGFCTR